jgi:hypothetical protein
MNELTYNIWCLIGLEMNFESILCWLSIWFYIFWAFEPSTWLCDEFCSFKYYVFWELASYLIETTFTLHVCMNMTRACRNLTILNLKSQLFSMLSITEPFWAYLSFLLFTYILWALNFHFVSYSLAKD